ncbi:hypothetical protein M378DRAFT_79508, partial [Amanita muscaria Koide BX008]
ERLQKTWRSPIYGFFKSDIKINTENNRTFHFFKCAATRCKVKGGGVRHYQDSQDRAATSNLKAHAVKCFGADVVEAAFNKTSSGTQDGSIFASFARLGQGLVSISHRAHTTDETSNRPMNIVKDRQFRHLMKAGRPGTSLPTPMTVARDVKLCFETCRVRIDKILKEHLGHVHFATDAWTSLNHRAFVAWTVHLHHEGHLLAFVLDVVEVPESHTGEALAKAFHDMLCRRQQRRRAE